MFFIFMIFNEYFRNWISPLKKKQEKNENKMKNYKCACGVIENGNHFNMIVAKFMQRFS